MTDKLNINLLVLLFFCFSQSLVAKDLNINAKTIEINKSTQVVIAEGDVEVTDSENNIINSKKIEYDKKKTNIKYFWRNSNINFRKIQD